MKRFLCYDTNDAASGKLGVNNNGVLSPNATVPSTNGAAYQCLVTDGDGNVKWEDRLAYKRNADTILWSENDVPFGVYNGVYYGGPDWSSDNPKNPGVDYLIVEFDDAVYKLAYRGYGYGNEHLAVNSKDDTGEPLFIEFVLDPESGMFTLKIYTNIVGESHNVKIYYESEQYVTIPEKYIPVMSSVTLKSSTSGSSKKFKITVDDSGTISATEVTV